MRWLAALVVSSVVLSVAGRVAAQERDATTVEDARRVVTITLAGDPEPGATEATLRDLFGHLTEAHTVALEVRVAREIDPRSITDPPPAPPPAFARVWIDVRAESSVISIADAPWERIYQRRMHRSVGNDEITREQSAQIVVAAIEAMLAGGTIGVSRATLVPPPPPPPPAATAPEAPAPAPPPRDEKPAVAVEGGRRPRVLLGVGYEALAFSSRAIAHGPLASLRANVEEGPWSAGLHLAAQWRVPTTADETPIGVRLDTRSFRLLLEGSRSLVPRVRLRAGVGPGLDVTAIEPRGVSRSGVGEEPSITVEAKRSRVSPVLRWAAGLDVRPSPGMHVALDFVLDHALTNRAYVVRQDGAEQEVIAPLDLRPGLTFSIAADLVRP